MYLPLDAANVGKLVEKQNYFLSWLHPFSMLSQNPIDWCRSSSSFNFPLQF